MINFIDYLEREDFYFATMKTEENFCTTKYCYTLDRVEHTTKSGIHIFNIGLNFELIGMEIKSTKIEFIDYIKDIYSSYPMGIKIDKISEVSQKAKKLFCSAFYSKNFMTKRE